MQTDTRTLPVLTPYEQIGGEPAVRALVKRFYELMDALPEAWDVRRMHAEDLSGSEEKLFLFLSGWFGGPNLYVERFGPPFLRARHLPFSIGAAERDQWMLCMQQALEELVGDSELRGSLLQSFTALADHMRNRAEAPPAAHNHQQL
ncbi:group II truncated hemoglobin [Thauera sp. CAU 1555]|uniref:Group II truncated hemoglobin n=1 Tax=Thauera sedimentorum TaxID=2767595 RepID=A0ABR9B8B5_9RHOO|nr:group II truncated hemoglobin [Thauera sedimentorum]MBC9071563.1 group II truncated hemoglobin [Thauera sedimentorum]MBD8502482.1 group II truncated hemoglobin [Thauera sedimentorum]